ncbi:hypothetical protein QR685DRAFT_510012 [Neurospora intermedia]|uniref:Uncharacterized protein n=1 Tax=Neurospora intermedia TaxID=5142 RepID=A0ABR3DPA7_NEUIN
MGRYILLHAQSRSPEVAMKKNLMEARQTSIDTHPAKAPEGRPLEIGVQIIATLYTVAVKRPPPLQEERE